ncbi:serine-rich adhesin for platelets-like [Ylistrum balloti]|uniref:serine-rich adhesin for platelets-like n=1 Tax=Ylistrum balloti TaxID=509963 RepID=UPI002905A12B|nr:serine-rich adhesin for platelets-like [Ylistrum balloti]
MDSYPNGDVPVLVNGIGTTVTTRTTRTEVRDILLPPFTSNVGSSNTSLISKTALMTAITSVYNTETTPLPAASNTTDGTTKGKEHHPNCDTASTTNTALPSLWSVHGYTNINAGNTTFSVSNTSDIVSMTTAATSTSTSEHMSPSSTTPTVTSSDLSEVITIDANLMRIKEEVMDEEDNTNETSNNLMENTDWFLDQVKDGYKECNVHQMDMLEQNLVCLSCQKLICALCLRDFHCGHDIISISKLKECRNVRSALEDDVSTLQLLQQTFKTEFEDKQELKKLIEQSAASLLKNVDTAFDQLLTIVENKRTEIKKHICDFEKQNVNDLCKDLERIKAIEQEATLMIRRVMVFFTKFDIVEARSLPIMLSEVMSRCKEFRFNRRSNEQREKCLPQKKFSNILPSLLAVTNICKTLHPEATKVVWSKITPEKRNGDSDATSKAACEDMKDPSVLLAHLAGAQDETCFPPSHETETEDVMEIIVPQSKKRTTGQKQNSGRGRPKQKRKDKDRSLSPVTAPSCPKTSKKSRNSAECFVPSTSSNSSTSSPTSALSSASTTAPVSCSSSTLPVITSVISLAENNKSSAKKPAASIAGLFDIDFKSDITQHLKDRKTDKKKVMAVFPSVKKTLNNAAKSPGRRPQQRTRLSESSSSSLESISGSSFLTSNTRTTTITTASPTVRPVSNSRTTTTTSPSMINSSASSSRSADGETGAAASTGTNSEDSETNDEDQTIGVDGFPVLSLVSFYPQTMTQGRTVMVRGLHGKKWLGYVSDNSTLKTNSYYFSVQWFKGEFGVDTKFDIQEKWQRKSDRVHTDCIICHFNYTVKEEMSQELIQQLKIASKQPPCAEKRRNEPPKRASPSRTPTQSKSRLPSVSPRQSREGATGTASIATRRGTPTSKSSNKSNSKS